MKTCERCGLVSPESSAQCECGGRLIAGDSSTLARNGAVAGFWIRLISDVIDAVFLGIAGWMLVMIFRGPLLKLGERAVLLGVPISLLDMAVLHSRIGGGQTPAKRLLKLRVVRTDGSLLSFDRAVVRWALIGFLFYGGAAGPGPRSTTSPGLLFRELGGKSPSAAAAFVLMTGVAFIFLALKYVNVAARYPDGGGVVSVASDAFGPHDRLHWRDSDLRRLLPHRRASPR